MCTSAHVRPGLAGKAGDDLLRDQCLQAFPTETDSVSLDDAKAKLEAIVVTDLFRFVAKPMQEQVRNAKKMVTQLHLGIPPVDPKAGDGFLKQCSRRMPFFCRLHLEAEKSGAGRKKATTLIGGPAAAPMFRELEATDPKALDYKAVEDVARFELLLSAADKQKLRKISAQLKKGAGAMAGAKDSASSYNKARAPKRTSGSSSRTDQASNK